MSPEPGGGGGGGGGERRRIEPWPIGLAVLLLTMIGICIAFYHIASAHPDPVISDVPRPGLER